MKRRQHRVPGPPAYDFQTSGRYFLEYRSLLTILLAPTPAAQRTQRFAQAYSQSPTGLIVGLMAYIDMDNTGVSVTASHANQQVAATSLPPPTFTPNSVHARKNRTWIIGAVIGPVVAILLFVNMFFLFQRRKRRQRLHAGQATGAHHGQTMDLAAKVPSGSG